MDQHSYARPHEARVTSLDLDLHVRFSRPYAIGRVSLTVDRAPGAAAVVLDTRGLQIHRVTDASGTPLPFALGPDDPILGAPLTIDLPSRTPVTVIVEYDTGEDAAALQVLEPSQTAGGRHPFLYSQGQAILTRTWIPTQDSPGIRQTFTGRILVPEGLRAVMSAATLVPDGVATDGGRRFEFRLEHPVPPYLIALAVGDLAFAPIGPRTGVYAEPSIIEAAAWEFADLERMLETAEALLGPYGWGRYDVLVLPPAFPFGGMENPCVTFVTPTVLAGDRSLVSLIAHELAHSWSGNLVTNATWRDFWLNEGFTTYVEARIMEALYGRAHADTHRVLAHQDLLDEIARLGGPSSPDTRLFIDLDGRDPDEGATRIPYDKGAALLTVIESAVGRDRFDDYLRRYFDRHAFTSITTATFLDDLHRYLLDRETSERLRVREWIFDAGLPTNVVEVRAPELDAVGDRARAFGEARTSASALPASDWTTAAWLHFLRSLPEDLSGSQLEDLDRTFGLSSRGNMEVLFLWLRLAIRHHYTPALPAVERMLRTQGRRKFLRPLYEDLMASGWGAEVARRVYAAARPSYHAVAVRTLDGIVK